MRNRKKLPIGIDSFEKIIRHNFYYVDKTEMITELLHNWGEVNLFTRPRRFGKSLNMNIEMPNRFAICNVRSTTGQPSASIKIFIGFPPSPTEMLLRYANRRL